MKFHEEFRHPAHLEFSEWNLRSALLPVRLAFKAVGSSIRSRIRSRCSRCSRSSRPDGLVRSSCFSKSCFFSTEPWRIQHGKDDDDTDIHRMHMLQLNRQTYSQIFLHNFFMYHKYIHIQNNYCRYCRCFEKCKTWACETSSFSALRLVLTRVEVCVVMCRGEC